MTKTQRYEMWTYDVWGNEDDGYDVNDNYSQGEVEIECEVATHNLGLPSEFQTAFPSDEQLRDIFGLDPETEIDVDGDHETIYVNVSDDRFPVGELRLCQE